MWKLKGFDLIHERYIPFPGPDNWCVRALLTEAAFRLVGDFRVATPEDHEILI
jgi:hypothetical protein